MPGPAGPGRMDEIHDLALVGRPHNQRSQSMSRLTKGPMAFHRFHRTPLEVGKRGFPTAAHGKDEMATRSSALEDIRWPRPAR